MEQNKTSISATIVADSLSPQGHRLTSLLVTMPRIVLAELNTHRMLSKNSASSRAIPFNKMVQAVKDNPFIPMAWQKNHKGMQGTEYITDENYINLARGEWLKARDNAINSAINLNSNIYIARSIDNIEEVPNTGITKQLCNRLLEPFMYHTVLISGTEWENFFSLRCPQYELAERFGGGIYRSKKDFSKAYLKAKPGDETHLINSSVIDWLKINRGQAEIHMMAVAEVIWDAMNESTPKQLQGGEWHIPWGGKIKAGTNTYSNYYLDNKGIFKDRREAVDSLNVKIATAMAARTSYTTVGDEKEFTWQDQIALHDRMANADPFHASPFEHCARAMNDEEYNIYFKGKADSFYSNSGYDELQLDPNVQEYQQGWCRNYRGFIQYRHLLELTK